MLIPKDAMAGMSPAQRAKIEASMRAQAGQVKHAQPCRTCVTQKDLDRSELLRNENANCKRKVITQNTRHLEIEEICTAPEPSKSHFKFDATSTERYTGSIDVLARARPGARRHERPLDWRDLHEGRRRLSRDGGCRQTRQARRQSLLDRRGHELARVLLLPGATRVGPDEYILLHRGELEQACPRGLPGTGQRGIRRGGFLLARAGVAAQGEGLAHACRQRGMLAKLREAIAPADAEFDRPRERLSRRLTSV